MRQFFIEERNFLDKNKKQFAGDTAFSKII